ncbi:MAG TPA: glycosyltransferase [bacterium]|nr:glycosyltransferase [bacterium]
MTVPPPRLLLVVQQHSAARFIMADIATAFAAAGFPTLSIDFCPLLREPDDAARTALLAAAQAQITAFAPELLIAYGMEAFAPLPGTGDLFSRLDLPTVSLFFDFYDWDAARLRTHPRYERMTGPDCWYCCWDRVALAQLPGDGFHAVSYLPLAVNPAVFHCTAPVGAGREHPLSFVGIATPDRVRQLEPLAPLGLEIYGPGSDLWRQNAALCGRYHGAQNDRSEVNRYYNRSYMTVNITQTHGRDSLNMRVFEALSAGCLLLTDDQPVLAEHFRPGGELVVHHGDDLPALVRYFLDHPDAGAAIARRGCAAVRARHTYAQRVRELAAQLPAFLRWRTAYRDARQELERGAWPAAWTKLRVLDEGGEPFPWPEHLLFYCGVAAWQTGDRIAGERYFARLAAVNPASVLLAKISRSTSGNAVLPAGG